MRLDVCLEIWQHQQQEGYVFLSTKGKDGWRDHAYRWPDDKARIKADAAIYGSADLYFCPVVFTKPQRKKEYALPPRTLYADLDPVSPEGIEPRPTIAWASSKKRYQALWFLDEQPDDFDSLNRSLTYSIGADKGGWDITQVLRVPGATNYKYNPPQPGKLLWNDHSVFEAIDFPDYEEVDSTVSLSSLLLQYRGVIPKKVSRMLQYPSVEVGHRSDMLWYIEHELISAKVPVEDVFLLIKHSEWNKYKGRRDEDTRIKAELDKVYKLERSPKKQSLELPSRFTVVSMEDLLSQPPTSVRWMVEGIWTKGAHGMIAGEPKTFKSTIALDIAISVASGVSLWGEHAVHQQGPVVMIQNENADWIIKDRTEKILTSKNLVGSINGDVITWPPALPLYFINNSGYTFSQEENRKEIEELCDRVRPALIIFDPLYLMFEGDVNSAQELQPLLQWLISLKHEYNCSVMVIHHWNKSGVSKRGGQRMLGSTTLHGWVESALYLQEQETLTNDRTIVMEREFRGSGVMPHLALKLDMGDVGDPRYSVTTDVAVSRTAELADLLSMNPQGLSIQAISSELGISRRKAQALVEAMSDTVSIVPGARGAHIVTLG